MPQKNVLMIISRCFSNFILDGDVDVREDENHSKDSNKIGEILLLI